jgi:hypothetical protein
MKNYIYICTNKPENNTVEQEELIPSLRKDLSIRSSIFKTTNGKYTLEFILDSDAYGAIPGYSLYDIHSKISFWTSCPDMLDESEATDINGSYLENTSLKTFGYVAEDISKEFWNMRELFEKRYLTQESIDSFLRPAACLPIIYLSSMTENEDGHLVFEEGDKNI